MIPRVVIAGTGSGTGKTTVATGLIGALTARGLIVQPFKVGPDYIDPSYHALASGRPGRNLDAFLSGPELIAPLLRHGGAGADVAVIEGVMGMFDGASGRGELASTAHVAKLLDAPVILVVDGSATARSAAAVIHGFRSFDPDVRLAGVIFNRAGSDAHVQMLRDAAADVPGPPLPVFGALRRDPAITVPERHLGLTPAVEREPHAREALATLTAAVTEQIDLEGVVALARSAADHAGAAWSPIVEANARGTRIAIARGPAFSFHYEENIELLESCGAELAGFDPTADESLPPGSGALILAGGFPEVYGSELSANAALRAEILEFARSGRPVLAECGGLLYLSEDLDGAPMCGVLPLRGRMGGRLTLGYREAQVATPTSWMPAGTRVRGHEFHYSTVAGDSAVPAWHLTARGMTRADGVATGNVQAGYLHVHWSAHPQIASRFAAAATGVSE